MDATEHLTDYELFTRRMKLLSMSLTRLEQHVDAIEKRVRPKRKRASQKKAETKETEKLS